MAGLDLAEAARRAGWRHLETKRPYVTLFGTKAKYPLYLTLGTQGIPVRHVVQNSGGSVDEKLVYVYQDMLHAKEIEQVIVLEGKGFRPEVLAWFRQRLEACTAKKLVVLTADTCEDWFRRRLGAAGLIPAETSLRDLAETLRCRQPIRVPEPRVRVKPDLGQGRLKEFGTGSIGEAFVEAFLTWCGLEVQRVARDETWQPRGVDFLTRSQGLAREPLRVEAKTDQYATGNLALETVSNCTTGRQGWLWTSQANVLAYYFTKTDELFLFDLPRLSAWFAGQLAQPGHGYAARKANTFDEHGRCLYHTEFYAVPLEVVMREVPSVHVDMTAWLGVSPYRDPDTRRLLSRMAATRVSQSVAPVRLPAALK